MRKTVCKGFESHSPKDNGVKADDRVLIKLLGNWCQRTKKSDYFSSSFVWLVGSNPTYSSKRSGGFIYRVSFPLLLFPHHSKFIWCGKREAPFGIVDWVSHHYMACVTSGSFETVDTGKDFIEKIIVFTKVRIYLYIVFWQFEIWKV